MGVYDEAPVFLQFDKSTTLAKSSGLNGSGSIDYF